MPNEIFISYSRQNLDFVQQILKGLNAVGIDPWLDLEDIRPASQWQQEILIAVQACHNFLFILSPASCASEYCQWELQHALMHNKRIIPILCKPCEFNSIPYALRELNWLNFDKFEEGMKLLLELLDSPFGVSVGPSLNALIRIQTEGEISRIFYLYRNHYLLGRNPQARIEKYGIIFVKNPKVSRTHLSLARRENRWQVLDGWVRDGMNVSNAYQPSTNGIRLNGYKLAQGERHPLRHGDEIQLAPETTVLYQEVIPLLKGETSGGTDDKETYT